jgi:hypothetical protein
VDTRQDIASWARLGLAMGRISLLPTVWSNCLAGWWLGGGGSIGRLVLLWWGVTCLYLGGALLNDACDAPHDAIFRRMRPIPAGDIDQRTIWLASLTLLALGALSLSWFGKATTILTLCLVGMIVLFNASHKVFTGSPVLMAAGRWGLYVVSASAAVDGVTGLAAWSGLALAVYVLGVDALARSKRPGGALPFWPTLFLSAPWLLAWLVNGDGYQSIAWALSLLFGLWVFLCLRYAFGTPTQNVAHAINGLTAGMVLADFLAVGPETLWLGTLFIPFYVAVLVLQRFVPNP